MHSPKPRSLARSRDGRLFLAAQALDSAAIGVAGVALPWLVLDRGGSAALAGLAYPLTLVPFVLFGLPAGLAGDRRGWRAVMFGAHAFQALASAVVPLWALAGGPPVGVALAAGFAVGSGRVFSDAAAFGAVASVVGSKQFLAGQSTLSVVWSAGMLAGPALGGLLIGLVGPAYTLAAESAALALAAVLVASIRARPARPSADAEAAVHGIGAGVRFIVGNRAVRAYTAAGVAFSLATAGAFALEVPLLRDSVGLSSAAVGLLLAAGAVAGALAASITARLNARVGPVAVVTLVLGGMPAAIALLGAARGAAAALAAILAYSACQWIESTAFIGERQRRAPEDLQARVGIAGRMIFLGAATAGAALASGVAGVLGLRELFYAMAAAGGLVALAGVPAVARAVRAEALEAESPAAR